MKLFRGAGSLLMAGVAGLLACQGSLADTIVAPTDFNMPGALSSIGWDYGCFYEYGPNGCGISGPFGNTVGGSLSGTGGFLLGSMGVPTDSFVPVNFEGFSYSEVDDANGNPLDYIAFSNGNVSSPVTFGFFTDSFETATEAVSGFATTLYSFGDPFTATVSAYNAQGQLLGTTSATSVADPNDVCAGYFLCQSAFVGVEDVSSQFNNIASVVISTQDNWFAFGTVEVASVPEPGTASLILLAAGSVLLIGMFPRRLVLQCRNAYFKSRYFRSLR